MQQKILVQALAVAAIWMGVSSAMGRDTQHVMPGKQSAQLDRSLLQQGSHQATQQIAMEFAAFAGSQENAEALVNGLINSTPMLLNGTSQVERHGKTSQVVTHCIIIPPTKPMGFGEAYVTLSMIKAQLAAADIPAPTPQQLQSILIAGSDTANVLNIGDLQLKQRLLKQGVLTQRAAGMTWQQIAQENGVALAPILASMKTANYARLVKQSATEREGKPKPILNVTQTRGLGVVSASSSIVFGGQAADF